MKFRYFFIIILVIELFLQINRIVNKGNYFSVKQEVSLEKAAAKSSKVKFEHPQKILVYQNTASEQSQRITKNLEEAFKYNKINYKLVDIGEVVPTAEYDVFVFATDTFIGFHREMFDGILKEVSENGKGLVFLNNTPYNPFNEAAGIIKTGKIIERSTGIKFSEHLFPGLDAHEPSENLIVYPTMEVETEKDIKVFAKNKEGIPLLWERKYNKGRILYTNASFFADKTARGLMNQWIAYGSDWYITPIMNARLMHIDDFPAPIPRGADSVINTHYHVGTRDFYRQIWWKDMLEIGSRRKIIYSGFIIIDYNHAVRKGLMNRISDLTLKDLSLNGRELFLDEGEMGVHGYNHNPLLYDRKDVDFAALNYKPWATQEDMAAGIDQVNKYVEELFGKNVKLYTYVPPSNMLRKEGLEMLVKNYPDLKAISSLFYGTDSGGVYIQEIGRNKDFPSVYNLPRFSSGFYYDEDEMWDIFNAFAVYGYWSHFIHPDDLISKDRSRNKSWVELKEEFEKVIVSVEDKLPFLEPMRAMDMTKRYINIEDLKIQSEKRGSDIHIALTDYREPFKALIRINGKKIKGISSGSFEEVYTAGNSKIYLLSIEKEDITIQLGD